MHQSTIISCFSVDEFSRVHTIEDFLIFLNKCSAALWGTAAKPFDASQLIALGDRNNPNRYQSFQIKKKTHGFRTIHAPCEELKRIQKILSLVLTSFHHKNDVSFGFEIGKSIVDNARVHVKQEYILNIDLKDFFFSFNDQMVLKGLKKVGFITSRQSNDLVELILHLLTHDIDGLTAVLPQGSPASPIITNILCEELDNDLQVLANMYACKYSRYADDISFSSKTNVFKKKGRFYQELIKTIQSKYGLLVNEKKYRVLSKKYRQVVTGIVVNEELNVRRVFLKEIRMWLYYWERYGYRYANLLFLNKYAKDDLNSKALKSFLMGRINYIKQVKGFDSSTYLKYLSRIDQLIKREYKPIFKYAITLTHLDTTILNEAEYARAQNLLSKIDIAYVKANIFLKLQDFKNGSEYVVSRKNPFVFEYLGYNKKNIKAVLYVNTSEGPIKIGAVPDNRRFTVNGEPFNIDNYAHVTAINPAFTQLEGNTYILTGPGKDFRDLYKKMEAAYPVLDKFADQFSKGNPVTVDNKTLNEIFDFNQAFNITQNYTREKLSDLGDYADFEIELWDVIENGERKSRKVKGKIVRTSNSGNIDYYLINNDGTHKITGDMGDLFDNLESIVSESFESGYMTFYKDIKEINNPNMPGRTIVKDSYKAVGLDLPNQENTPEFNSKFGEEFKVLTMQYEQARKELKEQFDTEGTVLNTLYKELQEAIKNKDDVKKKEISTRISNEKSTFFKSKGLDNVGKKWFFAVGRKEGAVEFPIQVRPSLQISQLANEVQFVFDLKSFYDSSNNKVNIKRRNKTTGKLSDLSIRLNVKSITESGVELYLDKEKKKSVKINSAEDLMNLINKRLASYEITDDNGIKIKVPHVMSINSNEGFGRKETDNLGELIPNRIKNPFNLSLVPRPENISRQTKPKTTVQKQKLSNPVVENKHERTKFDDVSDIGEEALDFEGAEVLTLPDEGPDSAEMAEQNATSSMFGIAPTQPKSSPKPQTSEQQKDEVERKWNEIYNQELEKWVSEYKAKNETAQSLSIFQLVDIFDKTDTAKLIEAKKNAELEALENFSIPQSSSTESEFEGKKKLRDTEITDALKTIKAVQELKRKSSSIHSLEERSLNFFWDLLKNDGYTDEEIQKMVDDYTEPELPTFSHEELDPATQISIDTAIANLREILPANVSIQDIQNVLIKLKANGVPMGAVWNKVLYLNKAIKPGTEYHEAFHFIFKYFLNNAQRNALLKAAQNKYGKPTAEQLKKIENETDLRKGLSEKELTNIYYEELLADGFSQYKMSSESSQVYGVIELFYFNIVAGLYKIRRAWN